MLGFALFFKELEKCTKSTKSAKVSTGFSPTLTGPTESLMAIKKIFNEISSSTTALSSKTK